MTLLIVIFLVSAVGFLALILVLPFHARASGFVQDGSVGGWAELGWAWGLFALRLAPGEGPQLRVLGIRIWRFSTAPQRARKARIEKESREAEKPSEGKARGGALRRVQAALHSREALLRMALRSARALHLRLRVEGVVGTGDPADTALVSGLARLLEEIPGVEMAVDWEWLEEELELRLEGSARIWIAQMLGIAAMLMLARENRMALRAVS
jgi:hypothetical protein